MPGDDAIEKLDLQEISIVKIDVEGAEFEVIDGFQNTLRKFSPILIFEVLNHYLVATDKILDEETTKFRESRIAELQDLLKKLGYIIYHIKSANTICKISQIKPEVSSDLSITDYIAVHKTDEGRFLHIYPGTVQ